MTEGKITLFFWPTPNCYKVSILLEELNVPYDIHPVHIGRGEQFAANFLEMSPHGKVPAINDSLNTEAAMLHNIKNFYPSLESGGAYFLEDYGFYDHVQKAMQEVQLYNTKNNMRYFLNSRTMRSILEMLKNKTIFDDKILNKKILEDIFLTLENIEFGNYKHPYAAIAIMYKK